MVMDSELIEQFKPLLRGRIPIQIQSSSGQTLGKSHPRGKGRMIHNQPQAQFKNEHKEYTGIKDELKEV